MLIPYATMLCGNVMGELAFVNEVFSLLGLCSGWVLRRCRSGKGPLLSEALGYRLHFRERMY